MICYLKKQKIGKQIIYKIKIGIIYLNITKLNKKIYININISNWY